MQRRRYSNRILQRNRFSYNLKIEYLPIDDNDKKFGEQVAQYFYFCLRKLKVYI